MAGKGKPNFLSAMAVLKGKTIKGLAPTGEGPSGKPKSTAGFGKKVFGKVTNKEPKGGKKLMKDVQNV